MTKPELFTNDQGRLYVQAALHKLTGRTDWRIPPGTWDTWRLYAYRDQLPRYTPPGLDHMRSVLFTRDTLDAFLHWAQSKLRVTEDGRILFSAQATQSPGGYVKGNKRAAAPKAQKRVQRRK